MAIHARWNGDRNVLFVTIEGEFRDEDLVKWAQRATGDARIPAGHDEIVDLTAAQPSDVTSHTLRRIAELFGRSDTAPEESRVAIVASADVSYGLSRMYQTFRSEFPIDLRVFRQMEEARRWLGLDED